MPPDASPLTTFARGQQARIAFLGLADAEAQRLRELGLCEGCQVCVMMNADKCVLGLQAARIALQREVAMQLFAVPA
ncbi:MAG: ferrous iron transport protein A [Bacteroidetes bacterium]|nr:MAG: ferrous iron transport protein A [Bacteroidota bacterium]